MNDGTLFDTLVYGPDLGSIEDNFNQFHKDNPWVYYKLVDMTYDMKQRGRTKIGMGMLFEVLRWEFFRDTNDVSSEFKLNNNYRSRYARKIMADYKALDGMFETRELQSP